jgi:chromosome segregation ATPase
MQITRLSSSSEKQLSQLRTRLEESEAYVAELKHKVDDTTHALEHERTEQAKQYDYSASVQEELRQHNDTLLHSISEMENHHSATQRELSAVKKESATLLQENEERITHLETEILKRSTERRKLVDQGCIGCREHEDRNTFLEGEVVRLREMVGKMRMESADREGRPASLTTME